MNRFKLTNLALFTLSLLVIIQIVLPYSSILFNGLSFHQSNLDFTYCKQEIYCRHEVGHLMDDQLGHISKTEEFGSALMIHLAFSFKMDQVDEYTTLILGKKGILTYTDLYKPYHYGAGSSPQEELYADIYDLSGGDINNIPMTLRPFFSSDVKYDEAYNDLVTNKYHISNQGVIQMKAKLAALWGKVVENKEVVIKVGLTLTGAAIGMALAAVIASRQEDALLEEEVSMEALSEDEETEEETE